MEQQPYYSEKSNKHRAAIDAYDLSVREHDQMMSETERMRLESNERMNQLQDKLPYVEVELWNWRKTNQLTPEIEESVRNNNKRINDMWEKTIWDIMRAGPKGDTV